MSLIMIESASTLLPQRSLTIVVMIFFELDRIWLFDFIKLIIFEADKVLLFTINHIYTKQLLTSFRDVIIITCLQRHQ